MRLVSVGISSTGGRRRNARSHAAPESEVRIGDFAVRVEEQLDLAVTSSLVTGSMVIRSLGYSPSCCQAGAARSSDARLKRRTAHRSAMRRALCRSPPVWLRRRPTRRPTSGGRRSRRLLRRSVAADARSADPGTGRRSPPVAEPLHGRPCSRRQISDRSSRPAGCGRNGRCA